MKILFKKIFRAVKKACAPVSLAVGIAGVGLTASAQTPVAPKIYGLTNTTTLTVAGGGSLVTTSGNTNFNTVPIPIWRDRGFALHLAVYTTNASGSNVNAILQLGNYHSNFAGGVVTNWDNSISFNFSNNGTTEAILSTNVPKSIVDNYALARLGSVTNNHLSSLFVDPTNSYVSVIP